MDFISTKEAAENWGISQRRVVRLANEGRIAGAKNLGAHWIIPFDAQKPADGRTKSSRTAAKQVESQPATPRAAMQKSATATAASATEAPATEAPATEAPAELEPTVTMSAGLQPSTESTEAPAELEDATTKLAEFKYAAAHTTAGEPSASKSPLTKAPHNDGADDSFRFPLFLNADEDAFWPPLTDEERQLRRGQVDYYACRFEVAKKTLVPLAEHAQNRYVRIAAWYYRCFLAVYFNNNKDYDRSLRALALSLAEDFPHKKEMLLLWYQLERDFGNCTPLIEGLHVDPRDPYHPSAFGTVAPLTIYLLAGNDFSMAPHYRFDFYELLCTQMERDGRLFDALQMHFSLLLWYQMKSDDDMMFFHMHRGFEIAQEKGLYFLAVRDSFYFPEITRKVLLDFPPDFAKTITTLGQDMHDRYVRFSKTQTKASYWSILSEKEFSLVAYAVAGFSNRQVASKLKISEKTVSKRFNDIYDKLGVKSKAELVRLINETHKGRKQRAW